MFKAFNLIHVSGPHNPSFINYGFSLLLKGQTMSCIMLQHSIHCYLYLVLVLKINFFFLVFGIVNFVEQLEFCSCNMVKNHTK